MAILWVIVGMALAVYIGLGLMLFFAQSRILYQPWRDVALTPKDAGMDYEAVTLHTADAYAIAGWYIPAEDGKGKWTVLFCHGNAGNISHRLDTLKLIHDLGLNCLIVDYRGYGASGGKPTEQGTLLDIRAGWDWLVNDKQITPGRIILFGRSLGGSIAAIVAKDINPAAVILESSFTSFVDISKHYYPFLPVRLFVRFDYNTRKAVKELNCPVLIIHSPDDEIIPYKFGQQIFEAASEPKLFRDLKGGHNEGFYENAELYKQIWQDWIDTLKVPDDTHDHSLNLTVP
ncbi:MAG: alpha/beta hydrolase [Phycisphaerae bacterium]|nr:alpha/beta hydrolase [Phycisphaerae bacterium]